MAPFAEMCTLTAITLDGPIVVECVPATESQAEEVGPIGAKMIFVHD